MISEQQARATILASISPLPVECAPLAEAFERFAAGELRATVSLPPFDNSAMDGYALIAAEAKAGVRLKFVGEQPAGVSRNLRVSPGEAARIFTGAPIPKGADAVVMQEEIERDGDEIVVRAEEVSAGDFIRRAGGDLATGQTILRRGQRISAATLALLASQGLSAVAVHERATVAVLTTGDEIVSSGMEPRAGEIFESNGIMLAALARQAGADVAVQRHCPDDLGTLCSTLDQALKADALIISGGVSVGERDLVRVALEQLGAKLDLWRVSIKPGKPFLFAQREGCAVFGLPGNPVSSFVTFLIFVRPALLKMMGAGEDELELPQARAELAQEVIGDETRPHYFRGTLKTGRFSVVGRQESHAISGLARANALLRVEAGKTLAAGSDVTVLLIS